MNCAVTYKLHALVLLYVAYTIHYSFVLFTFLNTFIQQGQMKLIKNDSKDFYMVTIVKKFFFWFLFFK